MGTLVDYDKHYRKGRGQCGEPFAEFVTFFDGYEWENASVLDLGCGQGRDALFIARHGHSVIGVDLSEIGIRQMTDDARAEGLDVTGVVGDVLDYKSRRKFDVVILDRVLHLLLDDGERDAALRLAARLTAKGGHLLIADTPKHRKQIHGFFETRPQAWTVTKQSKNFSFARRR
jgi:SAM-dependent methyltransferase